MCRGNKEYGVLREDSLFFKSGSQLRFANDTQRPTHGSVTITCVVDQVKLSNVVHTIFNFPFKFASIHYLFCLLS
jgi:hypothetical protein